LADANKDFYNTAKNQTKNIAGDLVKLWADSSNKVKEIMEND